MATKLEKQLHAFMESRDFAGALVLAKRHEDEGWSVYVELDAKGWRVFPRSEHAAWKYYNPCAILRAIEPLSDEEWQAILEVCDEDASDETLAQELFIWEEAMSEHKKAFLTRPNVAQNPDFESLREYSRHGGTRIGAGRPASNGTKMSGISLDLPVDMKEALDKLAQRQGLSRADLIRAFIAEGLKARGR